ncbi:MAG: zinc ribbon domain-containing protein [Gammaproteobacteria bacterium]|jgi:putative FmdB family regulatory protein|nr:zinc ribbon domain-containing protein [Gammaproteobacteria bacterium]MDP6615554.1 zinc ribbon domain-containing protein [Gammaproteobacteria bacterium]MDP6694772.1 zinc ribbon domain-containing protein [Gammaproteobacteria bacterium]
MPIYEYECRECGHVFDALQKMSDDPLTACPDCGKPELRKLLSAPNFRLKGGGWYETDFKDKNKRNIAGDGDKPPQADKAKPGSDDKPKKTTDDGASGKTKGPKGSGD